MKVLVTGGAGGLGINVCKLLLQTGYKVSILDLQTDRNLKSVRQLQGSVEVCWCDITDPDAVKKSLDQTDIVVHMAAILPPLALQAPDMAQRINVFGTKILVDAIRQMPTPIPVIYTSSVSVFGPTPDAKEPLSPLKNKPNPVDSYSETKLQAEIIIANSGLDFAILRLTATPYLTMNFKGLKQMYSIPLNNRIEFCHPGSIALAIGNAVQNVKSVNGRTLIISGGTSERMLYRDMIGGILGTLGLPMPPEDKFTREPYYLDWYDTSESESLLQFQRYSYIDYLDDFKQQFAKQYGKLFLPLMRHFIGPVFGRAIFRLM